MDADDEREDFPGEGGPPPPGDNDASSGSIVVNMTQAKNISRQGKKDDDSKQHASAAQQDEKLKQFLANADEIESIEHFQYWKEEFLGQFRQFLDTDRLANAREADEELYDELETLAQTCIDINKLVKDGVITPTGSISVKGRRAVNEAVSHMAASECFIKAYWPKTAAEEKVCGYTKFELGAVLVRDGFAVFGLMVATRDYVEALMDGALKTILKPNQISIIQFYFRSIDSFVDTMADLGMYKLMKKCVEIFKVRPRKKKGKKKRFDRTKHDALSDTSGSDVQDRRMFAKPKAKFRSIMNNGWTSGLSREEIAPPPEPADDDDSDDSDDDGHGTKKKGTKTPDEGDINEPGSTNTADGDDEEDQKKKKKVAEEEEEEEVKDWIYYFDQENGLVGKIPRVKCLADQIVYTIDPDGNEVADGDVVEQWDTKDGEVGKTDLIYQLKQLLRGNAKKKKEGLAE